MSIYVDPEEYSCPQEPERLSEKTEKYLKSILMAIDWFQQDLAHLEDLEEVKEQQDNVDLPLGGYRYVGSIYSIGEYPDE
jgi:hypothetical protein